MERWRDEEVGGWKSRRMEKWGWRDEREAEEQGLASIVTELTGKLALSSQEQACLSP